MTSVHRDAADAGKPSEVAAPVKKSTLSQPRKMTTISPYKGRVGTAPAGKRSAVGRGRGRG